MYRRQKVKSKSARKPYILYMTSPDRPGKEHSEKQPCSTILLGSNVICSLRQVTLRMTVLLLE